MDDAGNLYIADNFNWRVRKVTPGGIITTVAGNGTNGYNGDNIAATSAELYGPEGVTVDGAGNLYIADGNQRIRKVTPNGTITTVAGGSTGGYGGDNGPATSAYLWLPSGVAVDGAGNLYIADGGNNRIRKVTPGGVITTVAGAGAGSYGGDNGPATRAELNWPSGVALDSAGSLYIVDSVNSRIRKVDVYDPPSLTFASTAIGAASGAQDLTVLNLGNTPLTISSISTATNFSLGGSDTSCGSSGQALAPAASCVLGIEFTPMGGGGINGSVVLNDNALNAAGAMQTIALQGTGLQQSQAITFPNPGTQIYGVAPITLTAMASSGLAVSYSVTSGPATVNGSTLSITGAGSVTVQANQSGNANYAATTPVSVTFAVNPATLTEVATNTSVVFGVPIPTLTGTLTGVVAGDGITASYTTTAIQGSAVGAYPITPTLNDPNGKLSNYSVTKTSGTLTIAAPPVVTATQSSVNFGSVAVGGTGSSQTLTFTVPSNLTLGSVSAVTQGAQNLDFTVVPGGTTCASGATNSNCMVQVQFLPTSPGTRLGGVVLSDQSGKTLLIVPLVGTGTGPLVAFGPGIITTVAGNGAYGYNGDNIPATSAELSAASGVAMDGAGNLYFADNQNNRIRKVTPDGTITTAAGNGTQGYNGDNIAATSAELYYPQSIAVDGVGDLYIVDSGNKRIRKVTPGGTITTVAGNGAEGYNGDNIAATSAELWCPEGVAVDGAGSLYIADLCNQRIRKVTLDGIITTVAGNGYHNGYANVGGYSGDGGPAASAELNDPIGVAVDGSGNLYIADQGNNRIRKVTPGGTITSVAGTGTAGYNGDNIAATNAELSYPQSVAVDGSGNLYIADYDNNRIRKVAPDGTITTVAGNGTYGYNGDNIAATSAGINGSIAVAVDGVGNLYIADYTNQRIRKVDVSDAPLLIFASTAVGAASVAQDFTVLNLGNAPLNISQITTAANFSLGGPDTTCSSISQTLAPAASCVLGIEFNPTVSGSLSGSVALTDNALNASAASQTVSLQGVGNVQVTPTLGWATPVAITYGTALSAMQLNATSGGIAGTFVYTPTAGQVLAAGSQKLSVTFTPTDTTDYSSATTTVPLTVALEPLTVAANNSSVVFGAPIPTLTGTLTGLVAGDGITASYTTTAIQGSAIGTYPVTATLSDPNGKLSNYTVTETSGTLTITALIAQSQTITFPNPGTQKYGAAPITLGATSSSGLGVSYTVTAGPATLNGSTLTFTGAGSVTVQATQAGNANYSAATPVSVTFTVTNLTAAAPTFPLAPWVSYSTPQSVTLADATPGVTIYYTTNGSTPTTASTPTRGRFRSRPLPQSTRWLRAMDIRQARLLLPPTRSRQRRRRSR